MRLLPRRDQCLFKHLCSTHLPVTAHRPRPIAFHTSAPFPSRRRRAIPLPFHGRATATTVMAEGDTKYASWGQADLVARVSQLEQQLRELQKPTCGPRSTIPDTSDGYIDTSASRRTRRARPPGPLTPPVTHLASSRSSLRTSASATTVSSTTRTTPRPCRRLRRPCGERCTRHG